MKTPLKGHAWEIRDRQHNFPQKTNSPQSPLLLFILFVSLGTRLLALCGTLVVTWDIAPTENPNADIKNGFFYDYIIVQSASNDKNHSGLRLLNRMR